MNFPERCEVAIIGGGPAGSALAALSARAGRATVLLERDDFPREKLCGEFLSMESQALLSRLGCLDAIRARRPSTITGARFFTPAGRRVDIAWSGAAMGLSRRAFDETLFRHAQRSGAAGFERANVLAVIPSGLGGIVDVELRGADGAGERRTLRADRIVAAYGRLNRLDRSLGRADASARSPYIGYKRRHVIRPDRRSADASLAGSVEIHLLDGGYCGVSTVEDGFVNVCLLMDRRLLPVKSLSPDDDLFERVARLSPSLGSRLASLQADGKPLATAQLAFSARSPRTGEVLHVGDAAGMIAPLCGDGQAMALESAVLLADAMTGVPPSSLAEAWDARWSARFSSRLSVGRVLQTALLRPFAAEIAARAATRFPSIVASLVSATRGESTTFR